jgi:hypothetical protein
MTRATVSLVTTAHETDALNPALVQRWRPPPMGTSVPMQKKEAERIEACRLRRSGLPVRQIAVRLGVSIASVSVWTRDSAPRVRSTQPPSFQPTVRSAPARSRATKRCGRCKLERPLEAFSKHPQAGRQHWCRACFAEYFRSRRELHDRQVRTGKLRRRNAARRFVDGYLASHPCRDCGESDPAVLEFDHLDNKEAHVSWLVTAGRSIARIEREINKCEVLCVSCHRRRTGRRSSSWRTTPELLEVAADLLPTERRNMRLIHATLTAASCIDCGLRDLEVLEFDHVGDKRAHVVELARRGSSLGTLQAEMSKCEIRCANCHRRRTRSRSMVRP